MTTDLEEKNKKLVLEAFDTLFNKRNYEAAEKYWSPNYIQHSAHIPPGRDGLFNLIRSVPPNMRYEPGLILADGDHVIVHGRFSNLGRPKNWIAVDIVRIADGVFAEHWDVLEDEATRADSQSGLPMLPQAMVFCPQAFSICASNSVVVVLPFVPVTAITGTSIDCQPSSSSPIMSILRAEKFCASGDSGSIPGLKTIKS